MRIDEWCYFAPGYELRIKASALAYEADMVNDALVKYESPRYVNAKLLAMVLGGEKPFYINRVIFSPPATIVFWADGTKTVVKCENEPFDAEKGIAMAVAKKMLTSKDYNRLLDTAFDYRESLYLDNSHHTRKRRRKHGKRA